LSLVVQAGATEAAFNGGFFAAPPLANPLDHKPPILEETFASPETVSLETAKRDEVVVDLQKIPVPALAAPRRDEARKTRRPSMAVEVEGRSGLSVALRAKRSSLLANWIQVRCLLDEIFCCLDGRGATDF